MRIPATRELFRDTPVKGCELLWKTPVEAREGAVSLSPVRLEDGTVVVNGKEGTFAFDPDGKPLWKLDLGDCSYRAPVEGPGDVLYVRGEGKVSAVEATAAGARVLWQQDLKTSAAPVVGPDGTLYVAGDDRRLHLLDPQDGHERAGLDWDYLRSDEPALLQDGRLVLQGYDGHRALVDPDAPATGLKRLWKSEEPRLEREFHSEILRPTGIGPDGAQYRVDGGVLRVLEPDGRTLRWEHDLESKELSVNLTLRADGAVYALSGDHTLTCLSPEGEERWKFQPDGRVRWTFDFDDRGTAYLLGAGSNHKAYAVDAQGRQKWATELEGHAETSQIGPGGTLLLSGSMAPLQVLDLETGRLIHHTEEGAAFGERPFLATSDGTIVLATDEGDLLGLRLRTPELVRERIENAEPVPEGPEIRQGRSFVVIGGVELPVNG